MTNTTKSVVSQEVADFINQAQEDGKTRGAIEGYLLYAHGMSTNEAKDAVQEVLGKSLRASTNQAAVVEYVRKNFGKIEKGDLIDGMVGITGGKHSSANHMYNYIRFAQEYARQEVEAALNENK